MKLLSVYKIKMAILQKYVEPRVALMEAKISKSENKLNANYNYVQFLHDVDKIKWYFSHIHRRCNTIEEVLGTIPSSMHLLVTPNYIQYVPDDTHKIEEYFELLEILPLQQYLES